MNFLTVHFILKKHQKTDSVPENWQAFRMVFRGLIRAGGKRYSNDLSQPDIVFVYCRPVGHCQTGPRSSSFQFQFQAIMGKGHHPVVTGRTLMLRIGIGRQSGPVGHYNDPSVVISSRRSGSASRSLSRTVGVHNEGNPGVGH